MSPAGLAAARKHRPSVTRACRYTVREHPLKTPLLVASVATVLLGIAALNGAGGSDVADAVMKGNKTALRALLQQKADVNALRVDGSTALQWAVYRDDLEAVDLLIRAGAKVDGPNRE